MTHPFSRQRARRLAPTLLALTVVACGDRAADPSEVTTSRSDSAGVEIVVVATDRESLPRIAALDGPPTLRLGSLDGPPEEQFGNVADLAPLPDGAVAILDGQADEVRLFEADGTYLGSRGSSGDGPGEFRSPIALSVLSGDTLAVFDNTPRRVTRFGPDGARGRITTLEDVGGRIARASFLPDGGLVGRARWIAPGGGSLPGADPTFVRDTAVLTLYAPDGSAADTIDVVPGQETITRIEMGGGGISIFRRPAAFARTSVFTVHPEGVWSAASDRFELRLFDFDGRLLRIVRAPNLERPVTDDLRDAVRERALSEVDAAPDRRLAEGWYDTSPQRQTQPAFDALVTDGGGRLWVREWSAVEPPTRWWVFAGGGELLGWVETPGGFTILAVTCDDVWGVEHDELDVSYVARYAAPVLPGCGASPSG
jgi:hypothetical protein